MANRTTLVIEQAEGVVVRIELPFRLGPKLRQRVVNRVQLYGLGRELGRVVRQVADLAAVFRVRAQVRSVRSADRPSAAGRSSPDVSERED